MQRRRDGRVLAPVHRQVKDLRRRVLRERLVAPGFGRTEQHLVQRLRLVAVFLRVLARPLGDEAGRVHLAVVEVGDLGAEQIVLHLRVARGQHVADQQRPADRAVRLRDRRNRDPVHAPLQRPESGHARDREGGGDHRAAHVVQVRPDRPGTEHEGREILDFRRTRFADV